MSIIEILELRKDTGMYLILAIIFLSAMMALPLAFAQPVLITVVQSDTCKSSVKCVNMTELIPLDNTNPKVSGKITESGREKPAYKNHYAAYQFSKEKYIVCVACDGTFQDHSKIIVIEASPSFKYVKISDHVIVNNTFYDYSDRHIDNCHTATVAAKMDLIRDTIAVLGSGCTIPSKFTEQNKTVKPYTKLVYCGIECQHQKFMKDAKAKSKSFLIQPGIKLKNQNGMVRVN